jgi:hypothetical protein
MMPNIRLIPRLTSRFASGLSVGLTLGMLSSHGLAETPDRQELAAQDTDSTVIYESSYFAEFYPVSANDMLNRIPGIGLALRGGGGGRGLGSGAGEVLINGQRMSGKANGGRSQLQRIAADQVDYIEIIRGTAEGLSVRGGGQIVNVVLMDSGSLSSTTVQLQTDRTQDGTLDPGGQFAYSAQTGDFSYLLSLEADPRFRAERGREYSYNADGELQEIWQQTRERDETQYQVSGSAGYAFERSSLQFNALYETQGDAPSTLNRSIDLLATNTRRFERVDRRDVRDNWEVGGDFEHGFQSGAIFRFLFIVNDRHTENEQQRFDVVDDEPAINRFLLDKDRNRERIGRSSFTWSLAQGQGLEVGVEAAQTILDSDLLLGLPGEGTASDRVGGLVVQDVANAQSTVQEMRYEPFTVHNWQINDRMSLESAVVYETSTIEQSGDVNNSRSFGFVKPRVDYRFDITPSLQLRAGVRKDVEQLSFSDFSATIDGGDEEANTFAGNPGIRQEQSWRYELNLEMRLPNDTGVVNSQFWYRDMDDVIGLVDVSPDEDNLASARGNIGDGKRYGLNLDVSTKLDTLGLNNALLNTGVRLRDSEVMDPFLGFRRRLEGNGRWSLEMNYRHDVTDLGLTYGVNYSNDSNDGTGRTRYDIFDTETRIEQPYMWAFVEKVAFGNTTFRLEGHNLTEKEFCRVRTRYVGATANGIVEEVEDYCNGSGMELAFKVRSTF